MHMQVTKRDQLLFEAAQSYLKESAKVGRQLTCGVQPGRSRTAGNFRSKCSGTQHLPMKNCKALHGVNMAPFFHQRRHTSPKFVFTTSRAQQALTNQMSTARPVHSVKPLCRHGAEVEFNVEGISLISTTTNKPNSLKKKKPSFRKQFKPKLPRNNLELATQARDRREMLLTYPYTNPQPHDFRQLQGTPQRFSLRTLKTPDPFNIHFKTAALSGINLSSLPPISSKQHNGKFNTSLYAPPQYNPRLFLKKGHYSPAFSAYNAYLDRVATSIARH